VSFKDEENNQHDAAPPLQQWTVGANGDGSRHSASPHHVRPPAPPPEDVRSRSHSPARPRKTPEFVQPSAGKAQFSPKPSGRVRSFSPAAPPAAEESSPAGGSQRASPAAGGGQQEKARSSVPQLSAASPQANELPGVRTNRASIMNANATALFDGGIKKDRQRVAAHVREFLLLHT
jgi:hypothetical protein